MNLMRRSSSSLQNCSPIERSRAPFCLQICSPIKGSPVSPSDPDPSISIQMSRSSMPHQEGISLPSTPEQEGISLSSPPEQEEGIFTAQSESEEGIFTAQSEVGIFTAQSESEEIINEDGILCMILSSLTLRDAVRTSVLSHRWRPIWTHLTKFYFNATTVLNVPTPPGCDMDGEEVYFLTRRKTNKFIQAVNLVLHQVQGGRVDQLSVQFFLDKNHSHALDAWVSLAVASKVKILRLQLFRHHSNPSTDRYHFPCHLLGSSQSIEKLTLMNCSFKLPYTFDGLRHLKTFILGIVDMSEVDLACILSNCSNTLVDLAVWNDWQWNSISFPHPLSQLQSLLLVNCQKLSKIEINAKELRDLTYEGFPIIFSFKQSSKLNKADICFKTGGTIDNLYFYLTKLSSSLPHLHFLTLKVSGNSKVADLPTGSSSCFMYLKHLDLEWNVSAKMSLVHLATLLDAAPYMEELKLHFSTLVKEPPPQAPGKLREMLPEHPHTCLRTVEVTGFYFTTWQIEIAVYLLKNAIVLQSMRIEKCKEPSWFVSKKRYKTAIKILDTDPTEAKLVIL